MNLNQDQNKDETSKLEKLNSEDVKTNEQSIETDDKYKFGWSDYSEKTNGRFAMLGFVAILLIELFSQKSFLNWIGLF